MRNLLSTVSCMLCAFALANCNEKPTAPTPDPSPKLAATPSTRPTDPVQVLSAFVVYTTSTGSTRAVEAVPEDASSPPVELSTASVDSTFAGVLSGRRVLIAQHRSDGSLAELVAVRGDGRHHESFGALAAGQFDAVRRVSPTGNDAVVELARSSSGATDVYLLQSEKPPCLLAESSTIVTMNSTHVAVLTNGNLQSLSFDGGKVTPLGGGDGRDAVADVRGDRIFLTLHAESNGDLRAVNLDGSSAVDFGNPGLDETAFRWTSTGRPVFARKTGSVVALISSAADGTDERVLTPASSSAAPIRILADDKILFVNDAGVMSAVSAIDGSSLRVVDPLAGTNVTVGAERNDVVVYRCETPHWPALRAAKIDGSGVVRLCDKLPAVPFFSGLTVDGRVVYYRSLAGQLEGGRVLSVNLDGTDERSVGGSAMSSDGMGVPNAPEDQDFESLTPAGRLIIEAEFEGMGGRSQLLVTTGEDREATVLTDTTRYARFAALVP